MILVFLKGDNNEKTVVHYNLYINSLLLAKGFFNYSRHNGYVVRSGACASAPRTVTNVLGKFLCPAVAPCFKFGAYPFGAL